MPTLKPFQAEDTDAVCATLAYRRCSMLWSDTGTGKTPIMISVADRIDARTRLVVCPSIAKINWYREIIGWQVDPLMPIFVIGIDGDIPPPTFERGWVIVNYERIRNGNTALLLWLKRPWGIAFIDEHQYLSSSESQRTNHFYNTGIAGGRLAEWFNKVVLASGTPMRNSPLDIWPHLFVYFRREIDGMDEAAFKEHFTHCVVKRLPSGIDVEQIVSGKNEAELMQRLQGLFIWRRRTDPEVFAQLPSLMILPWWLPVTGRALEKVNALADLLELDPFDSDEDVDYALENGEKMGASLYGALEAIGLLHAEYIVDLVNDIMAMPKSKVLVFAHHHTVMDSLMEKLVNLELRPVEIRGGQDAKTRQLGIDTFQRDAACRAAVVQLQVGATAVTLTAATDVIFAQMDWTATNNVQCIARTYGRVNDPHPVTARIVMSDDWLGKGQARVIARRLGSIAACLPGTIECSLTAALNGHVNLDLPPVADDWAA